ncbi:MAG: Ig-like domain-containing protein [Candidatus Marinimicrobia bacterium]|nr:Ig-like domain-containing protein [Candidatus Neomarinimicrobiota bacterium]
MNNFISPWRINLLYVIPLIIFFSCDEREPTETASSNYNIVVTTTAISEGKLVGEDISGPQASTRVTATVLDDSDQPVDNVLLLFKANVGGSSYGSFDLSSDRTDDDGIASVLYTDGGGNGAVDNEATASWEGVKVTAKFSDNIFATEKFNVYATLDSVWPYKLFVSSNVDEINLDNGVSTALVEVKLLNKLNKAVPNVSLSFLSNKGYIEPEGTTDDNGDISLEFTDLGTQEDIGVANIVASFEHPGANTTIQDSVQITINTEYELSIESYPVAFDDNDNIIVVGEDVSGDNAMTMLVATVMDTGANPVTGANINFTARVSGADVGTINVTNANTNSVGQVVAFFDDGGNIYKDTPGTPNFEGVILTASYGEDLSITTQFNVYDGNEVWPYSLLVNTDSDVIYLEDEDIDDGEDDTQAMITVRLINALGLPVENVEIAFDADHGFIVSTGLTDSTGIDTVYFTHLGDPDDVGISNIQSSFVHPGFVQTISNSLQINIVDNTFSDCAYIQIPPSIPGHIVVKDGGGLESTFIKAEIYDDEGNLIDTPTPVTFMLQPAPAGALLNETGVGVIVYTVNGIASVTINSGTEPGPVRVVVSVDCDEDGTADLTSTAVPVIISSGAPYHLEPEYDPQSTQPIGGGFYQTGAAALVSDRWYNPVEDSTYVYWTINAIPPDTIINAEVDGVSFTGNENDEGDNYSGIAYTHIRYATDAIGDFGRISATTYGANGDTITAVINDDDNAVLFFVPGEVNITTNLQYYDFTMNFPATSVSVLVTARVIDFYGNEVVDGPVAFGGIGVAAWVEVGYEAYVDAGVNGLGAGDGCFTWRDYGLDDLPGTHDVGEGNDDHNGYDTDEDGIPDYSEVSESFSDFGLDGVDGTLDEGEGDAEWNGYHKIDCEPVVKTDKDGIARIVAVFDRGLCILQNMDDTADPPLCTWDDFPASVYGTLMIPEITNSDPVEIQIVRSPSTLGCP